MVNCHFLRVGTVIPMTIYPTVYDGVVNSPSNEYTNTFHENLWRKIRRKKLK